jgi:hypothetical protein
MVYSKRGVNHEKMEFGLLMAEMGAIAGRVDETDEKGKVTLLGCTCRDRAIGAGKILKRFSM